MTGFWFINLLCMLAAAVCGGVLYRCRGGFIGTGSTTVARMLWWATPTATLVTSLAQAHSAGPWNWVLFAFIFLLAWVGLLIPHGWCQDRGIIRNTDMGCIGGWRAVILSLALIWVLPGSVLTVWGGGALSGLGYWIGWEKLDGRELIVWHPTNTRADDGSNHDHFAISGSEWGEVLTGAFLWAALVAGALPWWL